MTTTTTRRVGTPPRKTPSPTRPAFKAPPAMSSTAYTARPGFTQYVEAVPLTQAWTVAAPAPPAAPASVPPPASVRVGSPAIAALPTPPLTPPVDTADKQSIPIHINVNITNPNAAENEPRALKPIPFSASCCGRPSQSMLTLAVDYSSLIRRSPPKKERILALRRQLRPCPLRRLPCSPCPRRPTASPADDDPVRSTWTWDGVRSPAGNGSTGSQDDHHAHAGSPAATDSQSMSMDIDRDMQGHKHIHATLRDHTGRAAGQTQGLGLDVEPTSHMIGGTSGMTQLPDLPGIGSPFVGKETREEKHERKMREKQARREEREREKREREPIYKPIPGRRRLPDHCGMLPRRAARQRSSVRSRTVREEDVYSPGGPPGPAPPIPT